MIKVYRKRPVTVRAVQFVYSKEGIDELKAFCGECLGATRKDRHMGAIGEAEIGTLEDGKNLTVKHIATEGDYVIKGVAGEFYACKPEIFNATYEFNIMNDKDKVLALRAKVAKLTKEIIAIQTACPHINVVKVPGADTGNYCPADDTYWYNCSCQDCLKTWIEYV